MTIDKLKEKIKHCHVSHGCKNCAINNNVSIINALNAVDELVATLQPTPIDNILLYKEAVIKGEVYAIYNNNYTENGKEFKATLVELLIKHEE